MSSIHEPNQVLEEKSTLTLCELISQTKSEIFLTNPLYFIRFNYLRKLWFCKWGLYIPPCKAIQYSDFNCFTYRVISVLQWPYYSLLCKKWMIRVGSQSELRLIYYINGWNHSNQRVWYLPHWPVKIHLIIKKPDKTFNTCVKRPI